MGDTSSRWNFGAGDEETGTEINNSHASCHKKSKSLSSTKNKADFEVDKKRLKDHHLDRDDRAKLT